MRVHASLIDDQARPLSTTDLVPGIPTLDVNIAGSGITSSVLIQNMLVKVAYDYVAVSYPVNTQEVYAFKTGGSGGTTVATVTVNYVDASKVDLLNVGVA